MHKLHCNTNLLYKMAEVDELYLYLPSSVKSILADNTISHYTTNLKTPVTLSKGMDYEAALIKMIYPSTVENLYDGVLEFYNYNLKRNLPTRIASGFYETPEELIKAFNKVLGYDKKNYSISVDKITRKFIVKCEMDDGKTAPFLKLSENLQVLTGLPRFIMGRGYTKSMNSYDLTGGIQNIYCYCDLVRNVNVGDTVGPLLAVLSYKNSNSAQIEYEPKNPIYVPVNKNLINDITLELRTKTGKYIPFTSGETLVVIHIHQSTPSL